jgi:hypothetical protein
LKLGRRFEMQPWGEKFPDFIAEAEREVEMADEAAQEARRRLQRLKNEVYGYECGEKTASALSDESLVEAKNRLGRDTSGSETLTGRYLAFIDAIAARGLEG